MSACGTGLGAWIVGLLACSPAGHPIVAEVYYDAPGDDTGYEFVELYNPSDVALPLAGARLEAGDGAGPGRWTLRWTGGARDSVRAGGRFVVGGAHVVPVPDALVTLELQNGPDAMRMRWPDGTSEVVGWGALADSEYFCGAPAPDVPAGSSLARTPDGAQTGSNALDFRAAAPSPGRANQPSLDLAALPGSLALTPGNPAPGEGVSAALRVVCRGRDSVTAGAASVLLRGDAFAESVSFALPRLARGETLLVTHGAYAGEGGRRVARARVQLPGDGDADDDEDSLVVRVGPGPLELTEIQFHPAAGEGEWVEVRNRSGAPLALADFLLADRSGTRARLRAFAALPAESLAVLAAERAALLGVWPDLDTSRVVAGAPWPSLNNSNGADGVADVVTLLDGDGLVSDRVAYSASGIPSGTPIEKRDGAWGASASPGGTPLSRPRAEAPGVAFDVSPRRVAAAGGSVAFAWRLPWPAARVTVELYDLAGHRAARLLDSVTSGPRGQASARVDGVGPGLYVAVLRARGPQGTLTRSTALRVLERRP